MTTRGRLDSFTALAATIDTEKAKHIEAGDRAFLVFLAAAVANYAKDDRVTALAFTRAAVSLLETEFTGARGLAPQPAPVQPPAPQPRRAGQGPSFDDYGSEDVVGRKEAAALLGLSFRTLEMWATSGEGPTFVRMGDSKTARVRYRIADLLAWMKDRVRSSTTRGGS